MIRIKKLSVHLIVVIALVLVGTAVADTPAQHRFAWDSTTDAQPEAIGDVLNSGPHAGESPLAIGQGDWHVDGDIYVADLFTGFYFTYQEDLTFVASFSHPFGTATTTGVTFNDDSSNSLFICTAVGDTCIETNLTGGPIAGAFVLANPGGGLLSGMAYDSTGTDGHPSIWYMDIVNDTVIESSLEGTFKSSWGPPCADPSGCFGNGLDATSHEDVLDVLVGDLAAGQVTDVIVTDYAGTQIGATTVLPTGDTFVNDVVRDRSYLGGVEAVILVGNASNTIYVLEAYGLGVDDGGDDGDDGGGGDGGGVPATTVIGNVVTILGLLGGSAYFLRRRDV